MLIETATRGECMRSTGWENCWAICDTKAPLYSGDVVRVQVVGGHWVIKFLRCDSAGRWFLQCDDGLVPLSPWSVVPSAIMKVVDRRPFPADHRMDQSVPPGLKATERVFAIYAALTGDAPEFVAGIAWPGIDAALAAFPMPADFNERFHKAMAARELPANFETYYAGSEEPPSYAGIPPTNPTKPSEAVLAVEQHIAGTLRFTMDDPVVRPLGTRFQLIRSLVSNNAAVGTVVYDGATQIIDLVSPSSVHYYYSRAYVGSYFSAYNPNTVGIAAIPNPLTTLQVGSGEATMAQIAVSSGGTTVSSHGGGTNYIYPCSLGWVNNTDGSIQVQVEASAAANASTSNTAVGKAFAQLQIDVNGGGYQGYFVFQSINATVSSPAPYSSAAAIQQVTVPSGQSITSRLRFSAEFDNGLGGVTANYLNAALRMTAIKR